MYSGSCNHRLMKMNLGNGRRLVVVTAGSDIMAFWWGNRVQAIHES